MNKIECIFCKIARKEAKADIVGESSNFIAIKDLQPAAKGHTLIIPKEHYATLLNIPSKISEEMLEMVKKVASELIDKKLGSGFNLVMNNLASAGQVVMHAHIHVIPRKEGDGLRFLTKI
ncbi:MAG: HIT family protein [Nanoarchaeota archaeon]